MWHSIHLLRLADGRRLALRSRVSEDWRRTDPEYTLEREAHVLGLLENAGVEAPRVLAIGPSDLLLSWLPGAPPGAWVGAEAGLAQLAAALLPIHAVDPVGVPAYQRYYQPSGLLPPAWVRDRGIWKAVLEVVSSAEPRSAIRLIHRDYHAANTVWSRRRLAGVVDWTQASAGPPAVDLGHMRLNLAGDHGTEVADRFLRHHERLVGGDVGQPYWDLVSVADLGSAAFGPPFHERLEQYLRSVLERL